MVDISLFFPDVILDSVLNVDLKLLNRYKIKGLVLDVDNTLTSHGNPIPSDGVLEWLETIKSAGIKLSIVSNNLKKRVKPFADMLGLDYVSMGCKPLTFGITKACRQFNLDKKNVAIVGDQIFTDILAGNLKGITTFLVTPVKIEDGVFFRCKRTAENFFLRKYHNGKNR